MKKLRVLHVQHFVYPYRFPLFEELGRKFDLEVRFCRAKRSWRQWSTDIPKDQNYKAEILRAIRIGPLTFNPGLLGELRSKYDVYSVAALDSINVLQFLQVIIVAKMRRAPFIMVDEFMDTKYYCSERKLSYALNVFLRKILYRHIDAFVLWNKAGKGFVERLGVAPQKIFCGPQVLTGPHDGSRRNDNEPNAFDERSNSRETNVLYVGSLIKRKGVDVLIRAFMQLGDVNLRLMIVGNGTEEKTLRDLAEGDSRIVFCGHLGGRDKREVFKKAHVFVLPTLHEPWGFVINEALDWGLPVITTSAAGSADYLVKDNGFIVPPGDIVALRDALSNLISNRELMHKMGEASLHLNSELKIADMAKPFFDAVDFVTGTISSGASEIDTAKS